MKKLNQILSNLDLTHLLSRKELKSLTGGDGGGWGCLTDQQCQDFEPGWECINFECQPPFGSCTYTWPCPNNSSVSCTSTAGSCSWYYVDGFRSGVTCDGQNFTCN